jgi:phage terminase small subunit
MTGKRRLFVEKYLSDARWNATRAAELAGYADPSNEGYRLLQQEEVKALVEARISEAAMAANEVLARLAEHARSSFEDFVDEEDRIDLKRARDRGMMHLLKEYACEEVYEGGGRDRDPDLIRKQKIKLHDAQAALVQLGRHHGLFTDKVEQSGPGGGPLVLKWEDGSSEPETETET